MVRKLRGGACAPAAPVRCGWRRPRPGRCWPPVTTRLPCSGCCPLGASRVQRYPPARRSRRSTASSAPEGLAATFQGAFAALRDGGLSARRRRGVAVRTLEQQGVGSLLRLLAVGVAVAVACAGAAYRLGGRLRAVAELETFFASDADAAAFAAAAAAAACPRTYVYRLPPRLVDWAPPATPGTRVAPGVYVSADAVGENANLLEVVLDRLSRPASPCVATNPEDAELFLVPILPKSKHWSDWVDACGRVRLERAAAWRKSLPYLDDGNARRHFFVFPRVAYIPKCCLLYTSPSPRDATLSRMPSSA